MEVLSGVHVVTGRSNVYILNDGVVIDAGARAQDIIGVAESMGVKIRVALITHFHYNHTSGLASLKKETGCRVVSHELDTPFIEGKKKIWGGSALSRLLYRSSKSADPVEVDTVVKGRETVEGFRVVHLPGHTPGSVAYVKDEVAFTGDAVIERNGNLTLPRDSQAWDPNMARKSLRLLSMYKLSAIMPGHGRPILGSAQLMLRYFVSSL